MANADIRIATSADLDDIVRIHRETWRIAYADLLGQHTLDQLDQADTHTAWREAINHPDSTVHVAIEGANTVGFCVSGPATDEDFAASEENYSDREHVGLISTILVEPRWARRGHGGRLLASAAMALRANGRQRGICWLPQSDTASLNFFRRAGWQLDGTVRTLDTGTKIIRQLRLTGALDFSLAHPAGA